MKIGIEVQRLFRKKKFGIEFSSLELIRKLKEVGCDHEFVIFAKKDKDMGCLTESANLKIKTIAGKFFADFEQIFLPIAAGRERVDILHCTGNTAPYICPVPIVQTLHDVIFMDAIPTGDTLYQRFGNHYRRKVVPLITPRSQAVITVSEFEKQRIINRLQLNPEKIHVIYNGLNEKRFQPATDAGQLLSVRERYGLPDDFILFLGNQSFRKNPARAVEAYVKYAAAADKPIALVTPGLTQNYIVHRLRELKYPYDKKQFITPGYISDADLPALYSLSQIFMFPSLSEGFGMPIIEAMACGTPVITSRASCMPEIAGDAGILADPLDTDEIAAAITSLAGNERERRHKIEAGFENAKRFSWRRSAEKVIGLYESVYQQAKSAQKVPGFLHRYGLATRH